MEWIGRNGKKWHCLTLTCYVGTFKHWFFFSTWTIVALWKYTLSLCLLLYSICSYLLKKYWFLKGVGERLFLELNRPRNTHKQEAQTSSSLLPRWNWHIWIFFFFFIWRVAHCGVSYKATYFWLLRITESCFFLKQHIPQFVLQMWSVDLSKFILCQNTETVDWESFVYLRIFLCVFLYIFVIMNWITGN